MFRIDHYLGKETVQNILALRFANELFEPIWNAHYVDHVQITMAEDIGLGGRGGYYDGIGAARDVIQNHLMQLLALTAMEEPVSFSPRELQAEKIKVLSATQLERTAGRDHRRAASTPPAGRAARRCVGLLDEEGFSKDSTTETFAAITLEVDTRRWAGVPFYLRTGKRLGRRVTEIALVFKRAPHLPFDATMTEELGQERAGDPGAARRGHHPAIRLQGARQPDGGPRRQHGLLLRLGVRRGLPRGLRAADPRRAARRAVAVPGQRGGRIVLGDTRSRAGPLGRTRQARPVRVGYLGAGLGVRDAAPQSGRRMAAAMIVDLPDTTHQRRQQEDRSSLREEGGAVTMGRVLTLVIAPDTEDAARGLHRGGQRRQPRASLPGDRGDARRSRGRRAAAGRPDPRRRATPARARSWCCGCPVQLADHASSVVMPFLLPDTPVVAWWPDVAPAVPAQDPLGQLAIRRITDATNGSDPLAAIKSRLQGYTAGRHRPGVEPHHLLARAADLGAGPGAARADHVGAGVGPEDRTRAGHPGGLAGQPDRRSGARARSAS